jgi:hypothetical protein
MHLLSAIVDTSALASLLKQSRKTQIKGKKSDQLFFEVTAKKTAASWWLAPHFGQAMSPFSYSASVRITSKGFGSLHRRIRSAA